MASNPAATACCAADANVAGDAGEIRLRRRTRELQRLRGEDARRGESLVAGACGHRPGVAELHAGRGAEVVHGGGELGQAGNRLRPHDDLTGRALTILCNRAVREGRHADTAGGNGAVVVDQPVGHEVLAGHAFERGCFHDPVPQRDRAERRGLEGIDGHERRRYRRLPMPHDRQA